MHGAPARRARDSAMTAIERSNWIPPQDLGEDLAPSVHLVTFGCQMNKYDSELVLERFLARGYRVAEQAEQASVVLFNTCSVREHAEERVYSYLGALKDLKRERPDLVVGVVGCMAQREGAQVLKRAPLVDLVVGTREFPQLPELVDEVRATGRPRVAVDEGPTVEGAERPAPAAARARHAYVAVMRGCDLNCTYCIVPKTRGRVASRPAEDLLREVRSLVDQGVCEVTLLGQTVNSYGFDLPGRALKLAGLIDRLAEIDALERIHLVTSHPAYVTPDLIRAFAEQPKLSRYFPLPAQSGSDAVLKRMKRGYTSGGYRERVAALRAAAPDIELCSDWIVGFPGETDADFDQSEELLREIGFLHSYVFKYSPRPDTAAFAVADDVPEAVKKERNQRLLRMQEEVARQRFSRFVGRVVDARVSEVSERFPTRLAAQTRSGYQVFFEEPDAARREALLGTSVRVQVARSTPFGLYGERVVETAGSPA
jgi:tRNA-2-methylthio-N6-dimethylallyladenosine synthase